MNIIAHNITSMFASRQLGIVTDNKAKSAEKLASGYKINRSADDAAGLSISEKMRRLIRGLNQASENVEDGISLIQTGEGALNEVHDMLQRIRELAIKAANGTNSSSDLNDIDKEVQEIKEEMNRVYNTTEFNTLPIFRAPYIPDVSGQPSDFELFNGPDGSTPAGVLINHKRYTWEELGITGSGNDTWPKEFTDPDNPGELIRLDLKNGDSVDKIRRVYVMSADNNGILINNLYAGYWGSTINQDGSTFSFTYRGMDISIEAESPVISDVIERLKGDALTEISWDAVPINGSGNKAVTSGENSMVFNVTNSNKNDIEDWKYQIVADDEGVGIVQTVGNDGVTHTKTKWEDFSNTYSGEAFPISDWGTENEGNNPVTLDSSAGYTYSDGGSAAYYTGKLSFGFRFLENEVSKEQAKAGLSQELNGGSVRSLIAGVTGDSGVTVTGYNMNSFYFQRDKLNRDFGTSGSSAAMAITVERTMVNDSTVTDHEWRRQLSEAYVKKVKSYEDKKTVTYSIASKTFYETDGSTPMSEPVGGQYDSSKPSDTTTIVERGTLTPEYAKNTGYSSGWTDTSVTNRSTSSTTETSEFREVTDGDHNLIGYVKITFNKNTSVDRTTTTSLEKNGSGILNYVKNGDNYTLINSSTLYVGDSEDGLPKDTNGNTYRQATGSDGSAQRYIETGSAWIATDTYDLNHYTYSGKNNNGEQVMSRTANNPQFLNTGKAGTEIVIHDNTGRTTTYKTENNSDVLNTRISNGSYGTYLELKYNGGSGNRTSSISVNPNGPATRTITKYASNGGVSTDTRLLVQVNPPEKTLPIQAGTENGHHIDLKWPALSNSIVGISGAGTSTTDISRSTIDMADAAIQFVSEVRSRMGALQNRLEHAYKINRNSEENTQAAESKIRDTDMADEMVVYSKHEILSQAGISMLSQANHQPEMILSLLS